MIDNLLIKFLEKRGYRVDVLKPQVKFNECENMNVVKIVSKEDIPFDALYKIDKEIIKEEICENISNKIYECMEFEVEDNYAIGCRTFKGFIRVVKSKK